MALSMESNMLSKFRQS